ncbi:efflux RND transporter permease subunit [Tepidibacter hydrothermalis]|uniref:Efflux RND transporter permease subunit n=1 Tax=Tepidibacter hydrothermalis TaxID=3036126 RepID=A0ABY8E9Y8_9FIRM|nr:efflux RND transporter permease subunit [Tepidibacter hydrothermalis]WFD09616.1 efflux RND transporter permease subunit [Tepidibacter hydrothermalis]
MKKGITYGAIKNKKMTVLLIVFAMIFGLYSYYMLPRQESPDVSAPAALITAVYPGASPKDVEELVTKKIEDAIVEVGGYDYSSSKSKNGVSVVTMFIKSDVTPDEAWDELREKLQPVQGELPSECLDIQINTNLTDTSGMIISMSSDNYSYEELADYAQMFKTELSKIDGVSKFEIEGDLEKEIIVEVDVDKLNYYKVSLNDIASVIQSQNINIPSGSVDDGNAKISVKSNGTYGSIEEIKNTVIMVSPQNETVLRLKDIANVYYEVDSSSPRYKDNGVKAVLLSGYFEDSQNVVLIGSEVKEKIEELKSDLPKDIAFNQVIFQPDDVKKSINDFIINLIESIFFVIAVVFFGMGARNAIIVSTTIPLSICMTFVIMYGLGIKLEQMSISALIIALGMLVDNAIVVSDSIQSYIDEDMNKLDACVKGTKDVAMSMLTSTLTTVFAFAPLLLIGSSIGEYVFGVPSVVIIALICSYICAIITTPTLAYIFFKKSKPKKNKGPSKVRNFFDNLQQLAMKKKWAMISVCMIAFLITGVFVKQLDVSMFPKADKNLMYINIRSENASDIDITEKLTDSVVEIIKDQPEVVSYSQAVGSGLPKFYMTVKTGASSNDFAQVLIEFDLEKGERFKSKDELLNHIQMELDKNVVGGSAIANLLDAGSGGGSPIQIRVSAEKMERLDEVTQLIVNELEKIEGTTNADSDFVAEEYQFSVNVDENKSSMYGISKYDVQKEVSAALRGKNSSTFRKNGNEYDIVVKSDIKTKEELENLAIKSSMTGEKVLLKNVASVDIERQYPSIARYNRERSAVVSSDLISGYAAGDIEKQLKDKIRELGLSDLSDVTIDFDGEMSSIQDSFSELGILAIFSIILIIGVLVYQFNSYMQPLIIISTVPLALIGVVFGLFVLNQPLSFTAMLGIVSLIGIVVNNAIVLIDYINGAREDGESINEACKKAVDRRFSPIILSTTTTVIGLVPLLIAGGEMFRPMATALIGGLMVSTLLTLVVVPTVYSMVEGRKEKTH